MSYSYYSAFNCIGLLLILWANEFTKEIVNSVFKHIDQVISAILLSIIFLYWFVIIAYYSRWNGEYGFEG